MSLVAYLQALREDWKEYDTVGYCGHAYDKVCSLAGSVTSDQRLFAYEVVQWERSNDPTWPKRIET